MRYVRYLYHGKLAALTIKSEASSNICLTRLNLGIEPFSHRYHHAIDFR